MSPMLYLLAAGAGTVLVLVIVLTHVVLDQLTRRPRM